MIPGEKPVEYALQVVCALMERKKMFAGNVEALPYVVTEEEDSTAGIAEERPSAGMVVRSITAKFVVNTISVNMVVERVDVLHVNLLFFSNHNK